MKFNEGDVIVHDMGSATNESTWVRDADGDWRTTNGVKLGDDSAERWLAANIGKLIHRATPPKPAVELPLNDHHFGWLTAPGTSLARDRVAGEWFFGSVRLKASGIDGIDRQKVTAWEPGTLVPTSGLDELRSNADCSGPVSCSNEHIRDFLAAVDASKP